MSFIAFSLALAQNSSQDYIIAFSCSMSLLSITNHVSCIFFDIGNLFSILYIIGISRRFFIILISQQLYFKKIIHLLFIWFITFDFFSYLYYIAFLLLFRGLYLLILPLSWNRSLIYRPPPHTHTQSYRYPSKDCFWCNCTNLTRISLLFRSTYFIIFNCYFFVSQ